MSDQPPVAKLDTSKAQAQAPPEEDGGFTARILGAIGLGGGSVSSRITALDGTVAAEAKKSGLTVLATAPQNTNETCFQYEGSGPWWTTDFDGEIQPRMAQKGMASAETCPPTTLVELIKLAAKMKGGSPALLVEQIPGDKPPAKGEKPPDALPLDKWTKWTYQEYYDESMTVGRAFMALGLKPHQAINIWGFNAPEWHLAAMGAVCGGGVMAGIYPTDTDETAAYKAVHSAGLVSVIEDVSKMKKLLTGLKKRAGEDKTQAIKAIVAWAFEPDMAEVEKWGFTVKDGCVDVGFGPIKVLTWSAFKELGAATEESVAAQDKQLAEIRPGHCCGYIYTSGTTGAPKAVMISHDNVVYESNACFSNVSKIASTTGQERIMSYLPLSHVAGMMVDIVGPLCLTAMFTARGQDKYSTVHFARPYDLKAGTIGDRLRAVKPTVFIGVPLVWEKVADKVKAIGAKTTGLKKDIAVWGKGKGLEASKNHSIGGNGLYPWGYNIAQSLVLNKVKGALGFEELKFGFSGAAPIRVDTLEYYGALGIMVNEVYGMSECTGASTVSFDECHQWGSCGFELQGCQVRAFVVAEGKELNEAEKPDDLFATDEKFMGELCFRGRNIMMGYLANKDMGDEHVKAIQKKTADAIDEFGWLHSGDKGLITKQGMVKITGRYKELIIGEGGENIAPVPVEDSVKKLVDGVNEIVMIGDKKKYNVALVTLKAEGANGEVPGSDKLDAGAARMVEGVSTIPEAMVNEEFIAKIQAAIDATNSNPVAVPSNAAKIQKWTILPTNFSEEGGELTPTKKVKRSVVHSMYSGPIDKLYSTDGKYIDYSKLL